MNSHAPWEQKSLLYETIFSSYTTWYMTRNVYITLFVAYIVGSDS